MPGWPRHQPGQVWWGWVFTASSTVRLPQWWAMTYHLPECQGCGKMANRKRSLDKDNWELASHRIFANLRLCSVTSWWLWFWRWTAHFSVHLLGGRHTLLCTRWMDGTLCCAPAEWMAHFVVHTLNGRHTLLCTCWMDGTLYCAHTEWTAHFAVHCWMDSTLCCAPAGWTAHFVVHTLNGWHTLLCTRWHITLYQQTLPTKHGSDSRLPLIMNGTYPVFCSYSNIII